MAKRKKEKLTVKSEGIMNFSSQVVDIDLLKGSGLAEPEKNRSVARPVRPPENASSDSRRIRFWILGTAAVAVVAAIWIFSARSSRSQSPRETVPAESVAATAPAPVASRDAAAGLEIIEAWTLPPELEEISGNVFVDSIRMACIQDNDGVIFIYNLRSRKIEQRIPFGPGGDYEGIARIGDVFYVLRSDGRIFEVTPQASGKPVVHEHRTKLSADQDNESIFYDEGNRRLLVGVKEKDLKGPDKGVYVFDLATKKLSDKPLFSIAGTHDMTKKSGGSKKTKTQKVKPSELVINPVNGEVYVLNGPHAEFLVCDAAGAIRQVIPLDKKVLPQPEGMCFSPSGDLYISSEAGKKGRSGMIAKVKLGGSGASGR